MTTIPGALAPLGLVIAPGRALKRKGFSGDAALMAQVAAAAAVTPPMMLLILA